MKLEIKAYKCTFPNFFIDAYTKDVWKDPSQYDVIYGKSQKEAVQNRCKNDELYSYWELRKSIRTRRFKEMDWYSQAISDKIKPLSKDKIHHLTHSLGVEVRGYCPKEFYRNYSIYYEPNEDCEDLVKLGLMITYKKLSSHVYIVTEEGKEAVKTLLLVKKK